MITQNSRMSSLMMVFILLSIVSSRNQIQREQEDFKQVAQIFKGLTEISTPDGNSTCYYGWVNNYTIGTSETVQGYPSKAKPNEPQPVFEFKANSEDDYVIVRDPNLSETFVNIIQIGCQLFSPALGGQTPAPNPNQRQSDQSGNNQRGRQRRSRFNFVPAQQYEKDEQKNQKSQRSRSRIVKDSSKFKPAFAAKTNSSIKVRDFKTRVSQLKQEIAVDQNYNVLNRVHQVNLNLPSDKINAEKQNPDFISNIKVTFQKVAATPSEDNPLKKIIDNIKSKNKGKAQFTSQQIQNKRSTTTIGNQKIKNNDCLTGDENLVPQTSSPATASQTLKASAPVPALLTATACPLTTSTTAPLQIFSYTKQLFSKTIFGKTFSVTIYISATLQNNNYVRFKGTLIYNMFGKMKNVDIFNYLRQVDINWVKTYNLSGSYGASIYIPLPPPVSFLGINFAFNVNYNINVVIYTKGTPNVVNCIYTFEVGANVATKVDASASAAVRAIAIEGGVFIQGTLVNVSTDPKLVVDYDILNKKAVAHITWYFYVLSFQFNWGFFYRTWSLWKGWSGRKIIAQWTVGNGATKTYLIYKN